MEQLFAIGYGLSIRYIISTVPNSSLKLTGTLVGLWEGIVLLHFTQKWPKSFDPYVAYGVRLFIDFLVTQNVLRQVLVLLWTGMGVVLADITPSLWDDLGGRRIWSRFRRDVKLVGRRIPRVRLSGIPVSRRRIVRFSNSSTTSSALSPTETRPVARFVTRFVTPPSAPPVLGSSVSTASSSSASTAPALPVATAQPVSELSARIESDVDSQQTPSAVAHTESPSHSTSISDLPTDEGHPRTLDTQSSPFPTEESDPLFSESDSDDGSSTTTETPTPDAQTLRDISAEVAAEAAAAEAKKRSKPSPLTFHPRLVTPELDDLAPKTPLPPPDQVPDIPDVDMDGDEEEGEGEEGWEKVEKGDEDENGDEDEDDLPTPTATIRRVVEPKIDVKGKGKAKEVEDDGEPGGWEPEFGSAGTSYGAFAGYPQEPGRAPENIQILTSQIMHSPLQTDNLWLKPEPEPFPELVHTTSPPPLPLKDFPSFIPASTSHNKPNKLVKPEKFPSDSNWLDNILHIGRKKAKKAKGNAKSVGSAVLPVTAIADAFVHPSASSSRYGRDPNKSQSSLDIELSHPHTRTLSNNSLTGRRVVDMGVDLERERATADAATTWKEAMRQQEQQERVRQRRGRGRGWGGDEDEDEDADRSPPPTFSQIYPDGSPVEIPSESTPDLGDTKGGYPQANVGDEKGVNEDYASDEDDGDDLYEPVRGEGEDENDKDPGLLPDSKSNSNTDSTSTLPVTGAGATSPYQFPEPSIPPIPTIPTIPTIPSESSQASPQIAMPIPTMPAIFPWAASASQLLSSSSPSPALVPTPLAPAPPATQPEIPGNGLGPEPEPESVAPDAANAPFAIAVEAPLPPSPPLLFTLDTNGEPAPLSDPFPPELLSTAPATTDPAPDPDRPISSYSSQPSDPDEDSDDGEAEAIPANDAPTSATTPAFSPTDRRLAHLARIRTQISELKKTLSVLEGEEKSAFKTWGGAGKLGSEVVLKLQKAAEVEDVKRKIEKLERKRERVAFAAHNPDQEGNPNTINLNDLSPEAAAEKMRERIQKLMGGERTRDGKEESGEVLNKGSAYELNSDSLEKLMKEEEIEEKKSPSLPSAPSVPQFTHLEVVTPQSIKFRTVKTEVLRVLNKFQFDYNESENSSSVIRVRIPVTATNPSSSPVLQKSGSFSDEGKKKEGDS